MNHIYLVSWVHPAWGRLESFYLAPYSETAEAYCRLDLNKNGLYEAQVVEAYEVSSFYGERVEPELKLTEADKELLSGMCITVS